MVKSNMCLQIQSKKDIQFCTQKKKKDQLKEIAAFGKSDAILVLLSKFHYGHMTMGCSDLWTTVLVRLRRRQWSLTWDVAIFL